MANHRAAEDSTAMEGRSAGASDQAVRLPARFVGQDLRTLAAVSDIQILANHSNSKDSASMADRRTLL